jgi:hypothetical protein
MTKWPCLSTAQSVVGTTSVTDLAQWHHCMVVTCGGGCSGSVVTLMEAADESRLAVSRLEVVIRTPSYKAMRRRLRVCANVKG